MQLTERDQKLLLLLASVLLLAGAYVFGYKPYGERRQELDRNITELQVKYDDLLIKNAKRNSYIQETEEKKAEAKAILARYPSSLENQNAIYFTKQLEEGTGIRISQMSYTDPVSFYVGAEGAEGTKMEGMKSTSTISVETDYMQLKKLLNFMKNGSQRRVIQEVSLSFDSKEGKLGGTIAYDTYSLSGVNAEPEKADIPVGNGGLGEQQLFGDIVKK